MEVGRPLTLAQAIREARRQAGSHDRLARAVGTTRNTIIQWEKGVRPREQWWDALAAAGVPYELLSEPAAEPSVLDRLAELEAILARVENRQRQTRRDIAAIRQDIGSLAVSVADLSSSLAAVVREALADPPPQTRRKRQAG